MHASKMVFGVSIPAAVPRSQRWRFRKKAFAVKNVPLCYTKGPDAEGAACKSSFLLWLTCENSNHLTVTVALNNFNPKCPVQ